MADRIAVGRDNRLLVDSNQIIQTVRCYMGNLSIADLITPLVMKKIEPPCRIYFTLDGEGGMEHASFDVRPYMDARFAEYELTHVRSSLETTDAQPYLHVEDLKSHSMINRLPMIRDRIMLVFNEAQKLGWKMKVLPLEARY